MATESVKILISAEDEATAKIRRVTEETKKNVAQIKEVGSQAKASTEFVGTLATAIGGSELGAYAGQLAQITERVSAFSEVSKAGGKAALAFKAGLVAVSGVIGFQVGQAIGDVIWKTEEWANTFDQATSAAERLRAELAKNTIKRLAEDIQELRATGGTDDQVRQLGPSENDIKEYDRKVAKLRKLDEELGKIGKGGFGTGVTANYAANQKTAADELRSAVELHKIKLAMMDAEIGPHAMRMKAIREKQAAEKQAADQQAGWMKLRENLETKFRNMQSQGAINKFTAQVKAKADAEKAKQVALDKELATRKAIAGIQQNFADSLKLEVIAMRDGEQAATAMRLQMQGLDENAAKKLAAQKAALDSLKDGNASTGSGGPVGENTAKASRFLAGRAENHQMKIAVSSATTAKTAVEQKAVLDNISKTLDAINAKTQKATAPELIGD